MMYRPSGIYRNFLVFVDAGERGGGGGGVMARITI